MSTKDVFHFKFGRFLDLISDAQTIRVIHFNLSNILELLLDCHPDLEYETNLFWLENSVRFSMKPQFFPQGPSQNDEPVMGVPADVTTIINPGKDNFHWINFLSCDTQIR